jgi:predicted Zn-dependent protease with MMP-like domain
MNSFLLFIIGIAVIAYLSYSILMAFLAYKQDELEEELRDQKLMNSMIEEIKKHKAEQDNLTIVERIGCLGLYNGKEIPSQIRLKDGRLFEYVSLAVKAPRGYYYISKNPEVNHIKIDDNLLYKQVSDK